MISRKKYRYIRFLYSAGIETSQLEHRRSKKRIVAVLKESIECSRKKTLIHFSDLGPSSVLCQGLSLPFVMLDIHHHAKMQRVLSADPKKFQPPSWSFHRNYSI